MNEQDFEIDPDLDEPPLLANVRTYWQTQRGSHAMPGRRDIKPADLKPHLPYVLLVDVIDGGTDFRYRLVGSRLHTYFGGNPTGHTMREALAQFGESTVRQTIGIYSEVVRRRAPLRVRGAGTYYAQNSKEFDALLTPLSDDGEKVSMIFGAFLFEWDLKLAAPKYVRADEIAFEKALQG